MRASPPQMIATDSEAAFADRRRSQRKALTYRGWVNQGCKLLAQVQLADLSFHGMGFLSPRPLEPGAEVEMILNRPNTYDLRANLRVVSCRQTAEGNYRIGAEIV